MSLECACSQPTRQQETPATGGGRLRASGSSAAGEGRGDNSHALELRDNANLAQEFQPPLCGNKTIGAYVQGDRRAQFCLGNLVA